MKLKYELVYDGKNGARDYTKSPVRIVGARVDGKPYTLGTDRRIDAGIEAEQVRLQRQVRDRTIRKGTKVSFDLNLRSR